MAELSRSGPAPAGAANRGSAPKLVRGEVQGSGAGAGGGGGPEDYDRDPQAGGGRLVSGSGEARKGKDAAPGGSR